MLVCLWPLRLELSSARQNQADNAILYPNNFLREQF